MRTRARGKRHVRRPPDLTSLFDVLFIVVFVALIRAAAAQQEIAALTAPPPKPAPPAPPPPPAEVAALRAQALAKLDRALAARAPLVVRVATQVDRDRLGAAIAALELDGTRLAVDVPLLSDSRDPDVEVEYLGNRSADLSACRFAMARLRLGALDQHLVIVALDRPRAELARLAGSLALLDGLARDVKKCTDLHQAAAVILDPSEQPPPSPPSPPSPP